MQPYEIAQRSERKLESNPRSESWCAFILRIQDAEKETTKEIEGKKSEVRRKPRESAVNEIKGGKCIKEKEGNQQCQTILM